MKAAVENQQHEGGTSVHNSNNDHTEKGNPFQLRPSSSRATSAAAAGLEKAMHDLDNEQHMPENIDLEIWHHLVALRRNKVEKEQQVFLLGA